MNNSSITIDIESTDTEKRVETLRVGEARILRIIEAIQELEKTKQWSTLKTELFESLAVTLEKELKSEARKEDPDPKKLNRLAGELKWAEKYADLSKLENFYRVQLQGLRTTLYGK